MTFTTNYTFSKILGIRDGPDRQRRAATARLRIRSTSAANYGVLAYDHTHIFNAAYVVNLPSPVKDNKLVGGVVNGWVLSGITQFQSGAPHSAEHRLRHSTSAWPTSVQPTDYLGTNAIRPPQPALTCDPRNNLKSGQYFNPAVSRLPRTGRTGDIIWPYIKGPAFFNSDLAIYKDFLFKEHQKIEFRFSAFNFLNHPLWQFDQGGHSDVNLNFSTCIRRC